MRRIATAIILPLPVLVFVAAACGDGGRARDVTPSPAVVTAAATPADAASPSGGSTPQPDIHSATQEFAASVFRASYRLASVPSDDNPFTAGHMTVYKLRERIRVDLTLSGGGDDLSFITIHTPDQSLLCFDNAADVVKLFPAAFGQRVPGTPVFGDRVTATPSGQGACINAADDPEPDLGLSLSIERLGRADVTVLDQSTRTIAGRESDCYRTHDGTTDEVATACFSDGVLLYWHTESPQESTVEATDVSETVDDSVFDAPHPVISLPR